MKYIYNLLILIIALISVAAGIAKIMQMPQEVEFLQSFSLNSILITMFGIVQVLGGALLSNKKGRLYGAIIVALCFFISTILIFISGNVSFGLVSLLPVVLTGFIIKQSLELHIASQ
jgi:hypothetical protein